jgi:hypothetical protein
MGHIATGLRVPSKAEEEDGHEARITGRGRPPAHDAV